MGKNCEGCKYYRLLGDAAGLRACHYLLDTGEVRGCSADNCTKKDRSKGTVKKQKRNNKR